jgi:mono/diheme cytochrome c family protein
MLAGRVDETGPYKWTGEDSSLRDSFAHTLERIGGAPEEIEPGEFAALVAYVNSLPKPRPPSVADPQALARGRALFERDCALCHEGDKTTDRAPRVGDHLAQVDTPR